MLLVEGECSPHSWIILYRRWNSSCRFSTNYHFFILVCRLSSLTLLRERAETLNARAGKMPLTVTTWQVSTYYQQCMSSIQGVFESFAYICGDGHPVKPHITKANVLLVWSWLLEFIFIHTTHLQPKTKLLGWVSFGSFVLFGCVTIHPYTLFIDSGQIWQMQRLKGRKCRQNIYLHRKINSTFFFSHLRAVNLKLYIVFVILHEYTTMFCFLFFP